jgi:hypothetical protein
MMCACMYDSISYEWGGTRVGDGLVSDGVGGMGVHVCEGDRRRDESVAVAVLRWGIRVVLVLYEYVVRCALSSIVHSLAHW